MNNLHIDIVQLQRNVAIDRNVSSYSQLFCYFHKPLLRFAESIVKSKEAAEEIYSDVMLKIWDLGAALNNINNLRGYLFISVKNSALNYLARYYKVRTVNIDSVQLELTGGENPEESLIRSEFNRNLSLAVKTLPSKAQLVYKLIKEDGFSYRQVAEILGISVNTIEGHMTNALKKINNSLRAYLRPGSN